MNLYQLQSYENDINKFLIDKIFPKIMVDVGAHTGTTLKNFLLTGFNVYAFEPVEQTRKKLIDNFKGFKNFIVFSNALSNSSGLKDFYLALNQDDSIHEFYHSLEKLPADEFHKKGTVIKVETTTLNELIAKGQIPEKAGYLKIDAEGHDLKVLEGASRLQCNVINVEFWGDKHPLGISPSPPKKMIKLLEKKGYKNFIVISHQKDGVKFYSYPLPFDDDSWGNILFFKDSEVELFNSVLEFCEKLSKRSINNILFSLLTEIFNSYCTFIDIGAYIGKFTETMLDFFPQAKGVLFEPTISNYDLLKNKFVDKSNIDIVNCALDSKMGTKKLYCTEDSAQNSLLPFDSKDTKFDESEVETDTLDNFFINLKSLEKIDLIKIDTQGNDVNVLKGGVNSILKYKPAILMEIIFVPLYKSQGNYYEQFEFMKELNYKLSGIYDIHFHESGCLAFADFLFLPHDKYVKAAKDISTNSNFICHEVEKILQENKKLISICSERLELINDLTTEAEKRLNIINTLNAEIERLKETK
jgi:FkbM family methyltransferase